jgi:hypothetical protein
MFLLGILLFCSIFCMSACVTIEDDLYCALDVTVAIDFSAAMLNQTNIENVTNNLNLMLAYLILILS